MHGLQASRLTQVYSHRRQYNQTQTIPYGKRHPGVRIQRYWQHMQSHANKKKQLDNMREISRMEVQLEELYRKIDARICGLARRNQPSRTEQPRKGTRDGRPVCFSCGRTGHLQHVDRKVEVLSHELNINSHNFSQVIRQIKITINPETIIEMFSSQLAKNNAW